MAQHGRRRRSAPRVLPTVIGWSLAAAVVLVVALVATGRSWLFALAGAAVGVLIVSGVTALIEVTGVLNRPAPPEPGSPTTPPSSDGPPA